VQDHYVIGRDVGLTGTPAIVFDDGTLIGGYLPPDQLAARLAQNAAQQ
jgi:thiol:disulfide interchange protein DsbC